MAVIPEASKAYVRASSANSSSENGLATLKPAIYAYFHGQMYVLLGLSPRNRMSLIASNSRDGEMIARAAEFMGFEVARGSRTHGGVKGAFNLINAAEHNRSVLFPVDGPKGPFEIVKAEVIRLAQITKLPIIPVVSRARTRDLMKSWDRYNCPYLNTKMVYVFGEPLEVPANADDEEKENLRLELQNYMVELKAKTSEFFSYAEQAN
ncbi:MAG: hypothetical protein C0508_17085 [Cyanobacteria bacterium PR.023]|jgi:hypothetical protein|nr:hypothetical protein [Cyanobacteria bacterium PR.023]